MEVWNKTIIKNTRLIPDIVDAAIITLENPYKFGTNEELEALGYPSLLEEAEIKVYDNNSSVNIQR
jgi:hypothetical protein